MPPAETPEHAPDILPSHDARTLLDTPLQLPPFDVPGIVAPGNITALAGYTGAGKTPLTADLIASMVAGTDFVGIEIGNKLPDDYKFVYLTQESEYTFKPALERAGLGTVVASGQMEIVYLHEALATGLSWADIIVGAQRKFEAPRGLLIVDPISDWTMVRSEDDNAVMAEAFRPLTKVAGTGLSVVAVVHCWKSFDDNVDDEDATLMHIRGAGAIVSSCSLAWIYKKPKPKPEDEGIRFLKCVRSRVGIPPITTQYVVSRPRWWRAAL